VWEVREARPHRISEKEKRGVDDLDKAEAKLRPERKSQTLNAKR
jgi:hypothetical protein